MERRNEISIGTLAKRTGLAVSAIRYYETQGLVAPERNAGGQRRFLRSDIRRLSFVMIAQKFGFTLERIREVMSSLPQSRTPTAKDWTEISQDFRAELDEQIAALTRLRDKLDGCIGCGCLSLDRCALYNPDDVAAAKGAGPRYLLGDEAVRPED
ncbi:redox-sensitive transcriptional activator SoxR [Aliiroseovarius crassostreae]|uniref:redox-sensitive transcriptional activator SoxR n=1 Tax=Aliiroseovarius crassostreae TaxID=154981 RepID=UPI0021B05E24|nr:redox-sensitive transcriptional activator SoxR [Aliiroseovarius crassostreae]UWQ07724.1 redox-sensitive transcriptional activator SoxR [Aliiroseovarius crassostreae]UWQ10828.1 redox-sensitive transcriptional activator SoxR [Aliiroseovarius crassostreae]